MSDVAHEQPINLSKQVCWSFIDLSTHLEWREKCKKEIRDLLLRHLGDSSSPATLREKLGAVPISAWEDELPILEACIRESQRIVFSGIALRRNLHEEIKIGKQVVKRGDFLVYFLSEVHLNPEYYPEPYKWDPGRWLRPDPVPKTVYPLLAWGAGRHPCTGMKAAKLEIKLILAMFLMRYEFDLVDKDGKFPDPLPVPNRSDIHQVRGGFVDKILCLDAHRVSSPLSRLATSELRTTSNSRRWHSRQMVTVGVLPFQIRSHMWQVPPVHQMASKFPLEKFI